jgi:peptidyl-prolyl cis-trans isomerase A (cyclophilin A)
MVCGALGSLALLAASPAAAQTPAAPPPVEDRVVIETPVGAIVIVTDPRAPITSANFLRYVDEKRFDGATFFRGMELTPGSGLVQGGTYNDPDRVRPPIAHEPTSQTGLRHVDGTVSMARYEPGTATGDFFIILGELRSLDAGQVTPDDPGYAAFGRVVEGMDVVRRILAAPKSPTEGEGFMKGQMLDPRIAIISARRAVPE